MRIAIGADHRGASTTARIADQLRAAGHDVLVVHEGCTQPCDYPERAYEVARAIADGRADRGVLVCGTGIGMSIAANKVEGIRAALAFDEMTAGLSRSHNDANVLCISADLLGPRILERVIDVFFSTEFEGGRHARRVDKIALIERGHDPAHDPAEERHAAEPKGAVGNPADTAA